MEKSDGFNGTSSPPQTWDLAATENSPWLLPNGKVALETLPYAKGVRRFRQRQVVRACKYLIEPPKFDFAWMYQ